MTKNVNKFISAVSAISLISLILISLLGVFLVGPGLVQHTSGNEVFYIYNSTETPLMEKISPKEIKLFADDKEFLNAKVLNDITDNVVCDGGLICEYEIELTAKEAFRLASNKLGGGVLFGNAEFDKVYFLNTREIADSFIDENKTVQEYTYTEEYEETNLSKIIIKKGGSQKVYLRFTRDELVVSDIYPILYGNKMDWLSTWATGGTEYTYITNGTNYTIHLFTSDANLVVSTTIEHASVCVIAGGAGGGGYGGGGGGAGGLICDFDKELTPDTYAAVVGEKGAGAGGNFRGGSGVDSSFDGTTATGGGGGGTDSTDAGIDGGSGGGSSLDGSTVGLGTAGQGNDGGDGSRSPFGGGGGGGANATGSAGGGGNAGVGSYYDINGTVECYSGGGGGGAWATGTGGTGGCPGSGDGGSNGDVGQDATAGYGNGGGGGTTNAVGGDGFAGAVIVRYVTPATTNAFINITNVTIYSASNVFDWIVLNMTVESNDTSALMAYICPFKNGVNQTALCNSTVVANNTNTMVYNLTDFSVDDVGDIWNFTVYVNDGFNTSGVNITQGITVELYCAELDTADTTYTLTRSVSIDGLTCFNITENNIEIDCAGYTITGDNTSDTFGVVSRKIEVDISNCIINNFSTGINLTYSRDSLVHNNTINTTFEDGYGLWSE